MKYKNVYSYPPIDLAIETGDLFTVSHVRAANITKDILENIKNVFGGKMGHYAELIQKTVDEAIEKLCKKAIENGYDGLVGLKIGNPTVIEGGVEIIVYANGFHFSKV